MNLPSLSIRRHVLAATFSLVIVLLGVISFLRVGVDRNPDVDLPTLFISTSLPGASPETVALTVTQPLEAQLNSISGIDTLTSTSVTGQSSIVVTFDLSKDMAEALNDVQSRIGQATRSLPDDASTPTVRQFDLNAQPIMWLTLSGQRSELELTSFAKQVKERLETVTGVGEVRLRGAASRVLRITISDHKLAAYDLTYSDVQTAFAQNHINTAGGRLKTPGKEYQVELNFEYATARDLAQLPVAQRGGVAVRLGDLATIEETLADERGFARYNGTPTVAIGVVKASGANPVEVVKRVQERINDELRVVLPEDVTLQAVYDDAAPIEAIVAALQSHLVEGTLLTALVVWLFLKSVRATTIIATAIPVSLLGAVAALYFLDYTFNSFTLLALLLLIGVVVDDAIVVLENIYRVREHNPQLTRDQAAEKGSSEVMFAVMAATLTLVCVFGPVVFLPGIMGQFFKSFAVTVVIGVMVSWFVSMTLTPMLCAKFLKVAEKESGVYAWLERMFQAMERSYRKLLVLALSWRKLVLMLAAATLVPAGLLLTVIKAEFAPQVNEGRISVRLSVPSGHDKVTLLGLASQAEAIVAQEPTIEHVLTSFEDGGRSGEDSISLTLVMREDAIRQQPRVIQSLQQALSRVPDWRALVSAATGMSGGGGGGSLQFYLKGPDHEKLKDLVRQFEAELASTPGFGAVRTNLSTGLPQLSATLDLREAARLGISAQSVARAIATLNGQAVVGRYTGEDGDRYDIIMRSDRGVAPASVDVLTDTKVRAASGELVPLSNVVSFRTEGAATALQRVNQQYAVTFNANPTMSLGEAMAMVQEKARELPVGYSVEFSGQAKEFAKAGGNLVMVFGLALILLYLVLASQFNNYGQPFLVMLAQPLAVIGGLGALALMGLTLNIYSIIGLVLLVGLVAKNSILLVDRTNQLVESGASVREALLQACPERLRPVLMTSLTLILAMMPAAVGVGVGAESNQPLAVSVIGGMVSSTLLTLVVVPAAYALFVKDGTP